MPRGSSQTLGISHSGKGEILGINKVLFDFTIEQVQFPLQSGVTMLWQRLNQVFDHCSQSSGNLHILRAAMPNFGECEVHKIFPIGRPENHEQLARFIRYFVSAQVLVSGLAEQLLKLVDCNHGRCRIIDRRRQSLELDVDHDAECKSGVLLHGPLRPEGHG